MLAMLDAPIAAGVLIETIAVHFHDTYGQTLASVWSAVQLGRLSPLRAVAALAGVKAHTSPARR